MQLTIEGQQAGQQILTVLSYILDRDVITPIADGRQAAKDFLVEIESVGGLFDKYLACISQSGVNFNCFAQWITNTRYAALKGLRNDEGGAVAVSSPTPNMAAVITRAGDLADRHNVSNTHMPCVPSTFTANGFITGAGLAAYDNLIPFLLDPVVLPGLSIIRPCAYNRVLSTASRLLLHGYTQLTTREVRRRTVGLGS